jgi:hypothetical protein
VGYGNRHPWYQLPLVPIAAAFAGRFCTVAQRSVPNRFLLGSALLLAGFLGLAAFETRLFYRDSAADLRAVGLDLKGSTPTGSLIVVADYGDPTAFYYAERKGWHFLEKNGLYNGHPNVGADAIADLKELRQHGATHFVLYSGTIWWLDYYKELAEYLEATATVQASTPAYKIYRLGSDSH